MTSLLAVILAIAPERSGAPDLAQQMAAAKDYLNCGLVSLYVVAEMKGANPRFQAVSNMLGPPDADGCHSFAAIADAATKLGMHPIGACVPFDALKNLPTPAIVQIKQTRGKPIPHLLILLGCTDDGTVYCLDPPRPPFKAEQALFEDNWTGNILLFAESETEADSLRTALAGPQRTRIAISLAIALGLSLSGLALLRKISPWRARSRAAISSELGAPRSPPADRSRGLARRPAMSAAVVMIGLLVLALVAFLGSGQPVPAKLALDRDELKLGDLKDGEHEFVIAIGNDGDLPLILDKVVSSCTCATVQAPDSVAPKGRAQIGVKLRVLGIRDSVTITIRPKAPEAPRQVVVRWQPKDHQKSYLSVLPPTLNCVIPANSEPYTRTLRLVYRNHPRCTGAVLKGFQSSKFNLSMKVIKNTPAVVRLGCYDELVLGELLVDLTFPPGGPSEAVQDTCKLSVEDDGAMHTLDLPVTVTYAGQLSTAPGRLVFSAPSVVEFLKKTARVEVRAPEGALVKVRDCPGWLRSAWDGQKGGVSHLDLAVVARPPQSVASATIMLGAKDSTGREWTTSLRTLAYLPADQ